MSNSESAEEGGSKKRKKHKSRDGKKKKEERSKKQSLEDPDTSDEGVDDKLPVKKSKSAFEKNADGDEMMPLDKHRFVTVRSFKGKPLIDLREYYVDKSDGKTKPGKKGISLSIEQYENFKNLLGEIDKRLKEL